MIKKILPFLFLAILVVWLYFPIFNNFFQQDEWAGFANYYLVGGKQYIINSLVPDPGHYVPLFKILFATLFKLFGFDYWKWSAVSILWHIINSFLVYLLAKKLFKKSWQAIFCGILFAVFAAGQQATSWVVADSATHVATFFVLLSLVYFFEGKILKSIIMIVVSLLFKEISIGMFAFFLIVLAYQNYIDKKKIFDKRILYFVAIGVLYIIFRYLTFLGIFSNVSAPIITESQGFREILTNMATFPVKTISQTIIPQYALLEISKYIAEKLPDGIAGLPATTFFDNFYLRYVLGVLVTGIFAIVLLVLTLATKFKKNKYTAIAFFSLSFVVINSAIYALSPGRSSFIPIIDSRNLYLPSVGIVFFIISIVSILKDWKMITLILGLFIGSNIMATKIELGKISEIGKYRHNILNQISEDNLKLTDKQVFYTESDTSYYGLPDETKILPFQSGFGQTLLVWFEKSERFPNDFFRDHYLWPIDSQGYKEVDNRGFGYFRDFNLLKSKITEYNLSESSVIAYSWDSKTNKLTNISDIIRLKLKND